MANLIDSIYTQSTNWETSTNEILHSDLINSIKAIYFIGFITQTFYDCCLEKREKI